MFRSKQGFFHELKANKKRVALWHILGSSLSISYMTVYKMKFIFSSGNPKYDHHARTFGMYLWENFIIHCSADTYLYKKRKKNLAFISFL